MRRPTFVLVRLAELRLGEEFETSLSRQHGVVIDWGWVADTDRTGRVWRVRAVRCRFGATERVYSAELMVLVPFDRPHCRVPREDTRWVAPLAGARAESVAC